jgi:predicted Zn finger-like uncharacterized protein
MVIECAECNTRFRLADEKLKPGGTKVRCSKCKHIFTVLPPEPDSLETPTAISSPPQPEPSSRDDFSKPGMTSSSAPAEQFSSADQNGSVDEPPQSASDPDGESAFPFDKPVSVSEDTDLSGSEAASDSFDFSFEEESAEDGSITPPDDQVTADEGFSWQEEEGIETTPDPGPRETEESIAGDFDFDDSETTAAPRTFSFEETEAPSARDFSFDNTGTVAAENLIFESPEEPGGEETSTETGREEFDFDYSSTSTSGALEQKTETSEDDFDFSRMTFGESSSSPASSDTVLPPTRSPSLRPKDSIRHAEERKTDRLPSPPLREVMVTEAPTAPRKSPYSRLLVLLLVLLLALSGTAAYFMHTGQPLTISALLDRVTGQQQPTTLPLIEQIRLSGLIGTFIENAEVGQLFVIKGTAINGFPESRSAIAVKGVLFGEKGEPLLQQTVFCGNPLDETALRTLPFTKIEESMNNQFGDSLSNLNVAPGKAIPFTIVFKNLPAGLAEFTVEVADSRPGSK